MDTIQSNEPDQVLVLISPDQIQGTIDKVFFINDTSFILVISYKATKRLELWQFKDFNYQKPLYIRELTEIYEYYKYLPMTHFIDENPSYPFGVPYDCHSANLNNFLLLQDLQVTSSGVRRLPNNVNFESTKINSSSFMLKEKTSNSSQDEECLFNDFQDEYYYRDLNALQTCHIFQITQVDIKLISSKAMETFDLLILQTGSIQKSLKQKQTQFVLIDTSEKEYKYFKYFLFPNKNQTPALKYSQVLNKNDQNQKYLGNIFNSPYCNDHKFQQIFCKKNYFIAVLNSSVEVHDIIYEFIHILKLYEPSDQEIYFNYLSITS
eukprot:403350067